MKFIFSQYLINTNLITEHVLSKAWMFPYSILNLFIFEINTVFFFLDCFHVCRSILYMINLKYSLWKECETRHYSCYTAHSSIWPHPHISRAAAKKIFWIHKSSIMLVEFYYLNIVNHKLNFKSTLKSFFKITFTYSNLDPCIFKICKYNLL